MKIKLIFKLLLLIFIYSCSSDSNNEENELNENQNIICEGNNVATNTIVISNEEDIDSFLSNNYTELSDIRIYYQSDLSFLKCIEKIDNLQIEYSDIVNFEDLENISEIGSIDIYLCNNLVDFSGLESIESLDFLFIENCNSLINLSGFDSLTTINIKLILENNPSLLNLEGLNNLETLGATEINENISLTDISAINSITNPNFAFAINNCDSLVNLGTFDNLQEMGGLIFVNLDSLPTVNCFPNITLIGSIDIASCSVENISFPSLESISYLGISNNPNLTELDFTSLVEFTGSGNGDFSMKMDHNDSLETLNGFINLTYNQKLILINPFSENTLKNSCGLRNLILEQISSGTFDNQVSFYTSCFGVSGGTFNNITQFDNVCDCD